MADGGLVRRHVEQAGRFGTDAEPDVGRGEVPIQRERLAIQPREDRVERVLDDARVGPRGARREPVPFDERDPGAGLCEERGRGGPDDPAADDDDVGCGLAHEVSLAAASRRDAASTTRTAPRRHHARVTQPLPLLRQHDFRALLGARLTNSLATSALATVVGFQVYAITGDPLSLGWLGLVEAIPALSLVLFGGHVADRRDRRSIILVTSAVVTAVGRGAGPALARRGARRCCRSSRSSSSPARKRLRTPGPDRLRGAGHPARAGRPGRLVPEQRQPHRVASSGRSLGGIAVAIIGLVGTYGLIAGLLAISTVCLFVIPRKPMPEVDRRASR